MIKLKYDQIYQFIQNHTSSRGNYQLKLLLNIEYMIPNNATFRQILEIVFYHRYSSREMETSCKRDINFMCILEVSPMSDHSTFAIFRSIHFALCSEIIIAEMTNFLYEIGEISRASIFIDGIKIKACI